MKLKLFHIILIGASLGAAAIGGINHKINTMPCMLLSPGAKQMCQLATLTETAAAAQSGFILAGTVTALGCGLGAMKKSLASKQNYGSRIVGNPDSDSSATNIGELYAQQLMQRLAQREPVLQEFQWNWLIYESKNS